MKNKEKKHSTSQFPNIYRFITENKNLLNFKEKTIRLSNRLKFKKIAIIGSIVLLFFIVIVLAVGISLAGIRFYNYYSEYKQISIRRENLQSQINFWQSIADKYDGYKDAYFRIALLEYQLSDFQKAKEANLKALILDPNFDDAKKLETVLSNK